MPAPAALAVAADANVFLDGDTLTIQDTDDAVEQREAAAIISGYLYGRVPSAVLVSWGAALPTSSPNVIRGIAGRLVASIRYQAKYSEGSREVSPHAQRLYNQAIAMLNAIQSGALIIPELEDALVEIGGSVHLTEDHFYPNDSSGEQPKFTIDRTF